ncbi:MAG: hypothetical protein A3E88_08080 [Legionellales bacterium RIFCSPHIGHO2_12_FULL_35_11]|nr:MAG: hypothetical protein A3E88_08080 [Legionellales bacterium RIFCSPHIGHO2_12_FULL_35_11]
MRIIKYVFFLIVSGVGFSAENFGNFIYYDSQARAKEIIYEKEDGFAVVEGDILVKKLSQIDKIPRAAIIRQIGGERWVNGEVPYKFGDLSEENKNAVLNAMHLWETQTVIKFIEITTENAHNYPDYLLFVSFNGKNSSSFVGKQGGEQIVKIAISCKPFSAAHEIGHAIGLWHEQSRADRDKYVTILWDNIDEDYKFNFNQHIGDGQDLLEYDYDSLMHYSAYAFSKNGQQTITPVNKDVNIGQRTHLSDKDIAAIMVMYARSLM